MARASTTRRRGEGIRGRRGGRARGGRVRTVYSIVVGDGRRI